MLRVAKAFQSKPPKTLSVEDEEVDEIIRSRTDSIAKELSALPIFADLSRDVIDALCKVTQKFPVVAHADIGLDDEHSGSLVIVREGKLNLYVHGKLIRCLRAGQYIGETKFLGIGRSGEVTMKTETDCILWELTRDAFVRVIAGFPKVDQKFESIRTQHQSVMSVGIMIQTCELLHGLAMKTLIAIDSYTVDRFFFPGEYIFKEGDPGSELYLLVSGRVETIGPDRRSSIASEGAVVCFGELSFLGICDHHSMSLRAASVCMVRILHRSALSEVLADQQEALHLQQVHLALGEASDSRKSLAEFGKSPKLGVLHDLEIGDDFLSFLSISCTQCVYLHDQVIIDPEKAVEKCMFLVVSGAAKAIEYKQPGNESEVQEIQRLTPGGIVGEHLALGFISQHTTRVTAVGICCVWKISEDVLIEGLRKFPQEREKVLLLAFSNAPIDLTKNTGLDSSREFMLRRRESLRRKTMQSIAHKAMRSSPIFATVSCDFIDNVAEMAEFRIFLPGDELVQQGDKSDSMFVIISGEAAVNVHNTAGGPPEQVGRLTGGSLCGELTMLGVSLTRTATIIAATICTVWEITQQGALSVLDLFRDQQEVFENVVVRNLEYTVLPCIQHLPLFRPFDSKFKTLIYMYCERRAYWTGARMAVQGEPGRGLYVINRGMATLEANGCTVSMCSDGYCFGVGLMLGLQKVCPCSLIALQTCHVLVVTRESYLLARDRYPSGVYSTNRQLEIEERAAIKKFNRMIEDACRGKKIPIKQALEDLEKADRKIMEKCVAAWRGFVRQAIESRKRSELVERVNKEAIGKWIDMLGAAREQRKSIEHEASIEGSWPEPQSARPKKKKRPKGQQHTLCPYDDDLLALSWDPAPLKSITRPFPTDGRCAVAAEKHVQRLIAQKTKQELLKLPELPRITRSKNHGKVENDCDCGKLPLLLLKKTHRKAAMDVSALQPVLVRDHLPPIMKT